VYSSSAEEESLKLVDDFNNELRNALDSLGGTKPSGLLDVFRFWSSKHLQRAVDGFAFLRRSGHVDASKFRVRPAIEMFIRLVAAAKHPDLFYRIAYSEHRRDGQLLREADKQLRKGAQDEENWKKFNENWEQFDAAFTAEFPNVPKLNEKLDMAFAAEKAELERFYGSHYRIYSQYTHGALHASCGSLDPATDLEDNRIMAICALAALETLVSLGAKSPNHGHLVERLERICRGEAAETKKVK
jgi:hypothetical protein